MPRVVARAARTVHLHGLAVRPASHDRPSAGGTTVAGLPAARQPGLVPVRLRAAGRPVVRALGGRPDPWRFPHRALRTLPLARKLSSKIGRTDFVRVRVERRPGRAGRHLRRRATCRARWSPTASRSSPATARAPRPASPSACTSSTNHRPRGQLHRASSANSFKSSTPTRPAPAGGPPRRRRPLPARDTSPLARLRGRVLAEAVAAPRNVPGFDRSNVDGYAVRPPTPTAPARPRRGGCGCAPSCRLRRRADMTLGRGEAVAIATGGVLPRGADAVVMVEDTEVDGRRCWSCACRHARAA